MKKIVAKREMPVLLGRSLIARSFAGTLAARRRRRSLPFIGRAADHLNWTLQAQGLARLAGSPAMVDHLMREADPPVPGHQSHKVLLDLFGNVGAGKIQPA